MIAYAIMDNKCDFRKITGTCGRALWKSGNKLMPLFSIAKVF